MPIMTDFGSGEYNILLASRRCPDLFSLVFWLSETHFYGPGLPNLISGYCESTGSAGLFLSMGERGEVFAQCHPALQLISANWVRWCLSHMVRYCSPTQSRLLAAYTPPRDYLEVGQETHTVSEATYILHIHETLQHLPSSNPQPQTQQRYRLYHRPY